MTTKSATSWVVEHRRALRRYEVGNGHAIRLFKHTVRPDAYVQTAKKDEFRELASTRETLQRQKSRSQDAKEPHVSKEPRFAHPCTTSLVIPELETDYLQNNIIERRDCFSFRIFIYA